MAIHANLTIQQFNGMMLVMAHAFAKLVQSGNAAHTQLAMFYATAIEFAEKRANGERFPEGELGRNFRELDRKFVRTEGSDNATLYKMFTDTPRLGFNRNEEGKLALLAELGEQPSYEEAQSKISEYVGLFGQNLVAARQ